MYDKQKPHLVVLSGAGISAESGIQTFRDSGGLWEGHKIEDVATPEAFERNPELVLEFYNLRRNACNEAQPNQAHILLAKLEKHFRVSVITQNVDDLHERGGSSNILHLHGELNKSRSTKNPYLIYPINGNDLNLGDLCEMGSQLRPHIVWFGEAVPMIEKAAQIVAQADVFLIVGTSLQVYPAAGLVQYVNYDVPLFLIDPKPMPGFKGYNFTHIMKGASEGMEELVKLLTKSKNGFK
jgi:NAD-dependent deacetylase